MCNIRQIVNSVFSSNSFLLTDECEDAFLVDVGDFAPIKDLLDKEDKRIKAVFLTHVHYDHIYGIRQLTETFPECTVYTSSFGKEALASDKINFSRYHGDPIIYTSDNVKVLGEGSLVKLSRNSVLEVFETMGHDKSCLTYRLGDNVFSGDSLIPGIKVVTSFPHSNKQDAEVSRRRILALAENATLYPGHGEIFPCFQPKEYL